MDPEALLNQLHLQSELVAACIAALTVFFILLVNRKRMGLRWREWRMQRILDRIGSQQIRGLVCADGLDGYYRIDRLALTADAILLINYKPFGGNIYCAERISEWTQVVGQKSFKFENPLFEIENQLTALRLLIGNAPLRGFLFFNHSATFPKGHPESVLNPENIPEAYLRDHSGPPSAEIQAAWELLKSRQNESRSAERVGVKT